MAEHPLTVDVLPLAVARVEHVSRRHGLAGRCGGRQFVAAAAARVEKLESGVKTHVDNNALELAAECAARAVLYTHRAVIEHTDAAANDAALERAEMLLVEAAALLECVAGLNLHNERIRKARDDSARTEEG